MHNDSLDCVPATVQLITAEQLHWYHLYWYNSSYLDLLPNLCTRNRASSHSNGVCFYVNTSANAREEASTQYQAYRWVSCFYCVKLPVMVFMVHSSTKRGFTRLYIPEVNKGVRWRSFRPGGVILCRPFTYTHKPIKHTTCKGKQDMASLRWFCGASRRVIFGRDVGTMRRETVRWTCHVKGEQKFPNQHAMTHQISLYR